MDEILFSRFFLTVCGLTNSSPVAKNVCISGMLDNEFQSVDKGLRKKQKSVSVCETIHRQQWRTDQTANYRKERRTCFNFISSKKVIFACSAQFVGPKIRRFF